MSKYLDKPIIFIGFPRSGTTIISEIIMQHHKLAWVSNYQAKFPKTPYVNLLRNMFQNRFWSIRGQKNQLNKVSLLNKYRFRPGEAYNFWNYITGRNFAKSFLYKIKEGSKKRNKIRSFFERLVRFQNRERLAFKVTGPSRLVYLYSLFPDACFIRIKRDPLPTLRSLLRVGFWNEKGGKNELWWDQEEVYDDEEKEYIQRVKSNEPALLAALQYYKVNDIFLKEQRSCDASILEVAYEEFISQPENAISNILEHVGLKEDKEIQRYFSENEIYNRNKKRDYFLGSEIDRKVADIARYGVENFGKLSRK